MSEDRGGSAGEKAPECGRSVTCEAERLGDLIVGGLNAVTQSRHGTACGDGKTVALLSAVRDDNACATCGLLIGPVAAPETTIEQQTCGRRSFKQQGRNGSLINASGDDPPRADETATEVGAQCQTEAVEPLGVRGIAPKTGD